MGQILDNRSFIQTAGTHSLLSIINLHKSACSSFDNVINIYIKYLDFVFISRTYKWTRGSRRLRKCRHQGTESY